jgi:hypothetical protein
MRYKGRYWKGRIDSEEKQDPFEFTIEVDPNETDPDKKAIEKAKIFVMCELESTATAIIIENPQILIGDKWVNLA